MVDITLRTPHHRSDSTPHHGGPRSRSPGAARSAPPLRPPSAHYRNTSLRSDTARTSSRNGSPSSRRDNRARMMLLSRTTSEGWVMHPPVWRCARPGRPTGRMSSNETQRWRSIHECVASLIGFVTRRPNMTALHRGSAPRSQASAVDGTCETSALRSSSPASRLVATTRSSWVSYRARQR